MNAEQLAAIPGLQYVQMPVPFLAWWPGMDPFALVLVEHWPGYVDTVTHWLKQSHIDEAELIREGWTLEPCRDWNRYHPPNGPRPPVTSEAYHAHKRAPAGVQPAGAEAENAEPPATRYTTTTARRDANPHRITAHYADGSPARRADGTVIRYDAAGRPHEFTPTDDLTW